MVSGTLQQDSAFLPELMPIPGVEASVDSVVCANDSGTVNIWGWRGNAVCYEEDAPRDYTGQFTVGKKSYMEGVAADVRQALPGYDSGVGALMIGALVLGLFFADTLRQKTVRIASGLQFWVLLLCISEAVLIYTSMYASADAVVTKGVFARVCLLSGVAAAYYLLQLCGYRVLGYVFGSVCDSSSDTPVDAGVWLTGWFIRSQAILGVVLCMPAMVLMCHPSLWVPCSIISVLLYILARIVFIVKSFRIFYDKMLSWVCLILYLCALEIAPVLALSRLVRFVQS